MLVMPMMCNFLYICSAGTKGFDEEAGIKDAADDNILVKLSSLPTQDKPARAPCWQAAVGCIVRPEGSKGVAACCPYIANVCKLHCWPYDLLSLVNMAVLPVVLSEAQAMCR